MRGSLASSFPPGPHAATSSNHHTLVQHLTAATSVPRTPFRQRRRDTATKRQQPSSSAEATPATTTMACSLQQQQQQATHIAGRRSSSTGTPLRPAGAAALWHGQLQQRSLHTTTCLLQQQPSLQCRQLLPCQPSRLQRLPQLPQRPQVAAGAAGSAAAQQPWQPPQRPRGLFRMPQLSLWQLGGPLAWTYMLGYLGLMLLMPISALLAKSGLVPLAEFVGRATEPVALSAYYVSFSMALLAGAVNAVFGFLLAWVLVKYDFPGKKWIDAAVDLPFALPTSVAGLTLATVYGEEGLLGRLLMASGINVVYTRLGVAVAMIFVSFPFVVRTMQPVLQEMEREVEEAAWSLGASPWQTFTQVLLPPLLPPLLTGTALAFSRALGEFGSVVIVSSNFPFKDLIAPVLIFQCLEQYDFVGATVIGTVLLLISLVLMVGVNWLQSYSQRFRK